MKINEEKIEKLRILKINSNSILIENMKGQKGVIHITEVSNSYVVSLSDTFKVNDIVYGYLVKKSGFRKFYSLKVGHINDKKRKMINETGGGYLGLKYLLNNLEQKEK